MKFAIYTLGCKVNQADSQSMQEILIKAGYEFVAPEAGADIYIINTCVVTNVGQQKSRQTIRKFIRENPNAMIIVTGCYPQTAIGEVEGIPGVALIIGNKDRHKIAELIVEYQQENSTEPLNIVSDINMIHNFEDIPTGMHSEKTRAFLKIQEGCNQFCTYCIIPPMRGSYRSVLMETLVEEARTLALAGVKELILVAQETTLYGIDIYGKKMIGQLLDQLNEIPGLEWIRILYCYPEEIDDEFIQAILRNSKVCHYLDIPIQHASDSLLKKMGRRTTRLELEAIIENLRLKIPDIALRTTIICGFPGETDADHQELLTFLNKIEFDRLGVFTYSPEEGTPAATYEDQVPAQLALSRKEEVMELLMKFPSPHSGILFL